jgi:hypothetical protein
MNSKNSSRYGWAAGAASILVMGVMLIHPTDAVADQLEGDGGPAAVCPQGGPDIDDVVAERKIATAQDYVDRRR